MLAVVEMSLWPSHSWICFIGTPLFQQQAGTGVAQIVEADLPQAVVDQQLGEAVGHCVG